MGRVGLLRNMAPNTSSSTRLAFANTAIRGLATSKGNPPDRSQSFVEDEPVSKHAMETSRRYYWIEAEAEKLIAESYKLHMPNKPYPPSAGFDRKRLEDLRTLPHLPAKTFSDKVALRIVDILEKVMHLFFRSKYDHHAVTLETVAAVPGMVAGMHRHMRSLRRMTRDHGWIDKMLEEAQNERMHLLIWMQHTKPSLIERWFVLAAQGVYTTVYSFLYVVSPMTAHRTVGYLEESAFRAYTDYLKAVDDGHIPNVVLASNSIGKRFYRLQDGSTLRDLILHVRADEAFHALYNHGLSTQIQEGGIDKEVIDLDEAPDVIAAELKEGADKKKNSLSQ